MILNSRRYNPPLNFTMVFLENFDFQFISGTVNLSFPEKAILVTQYVFNRYVGHLYRCYG